MRKQGKINDYLKCLLEDFIAVGEELRIKDNLKLEIKMSRYINILESPLTRLADLYTEDISREEKKKVFDYLIALDKVKRLTLIEKITRDFIEKKEGRPIHSVEVVKKAYSDLEVLGIF